MDKKALEEDTHASFTKDKSLLSKRTIYILEEDMSLAEQRLIKKIFGAREPNANTTSLFYYS